jgi:hypothetical protein
MLGVGDKLPEPYFIIIYAVSACLRRVKLEGRNALKPLLLRLKKRQNFTAGAHAGADGAFVRGAGLNVLRAKGDAADLLAGVKAR